MLYSKKAAAIWMSWVLLMAFVVGLSVFMFGWADDQTESFSKSLRRMYDTAECDSVGLRIDEICQNPQYLNMKVANRNTISINQLVVNIFDVYIETPLSRVINVTIAPDNVENIRVLKQSTTQQIEIIPVVITESDMIFCYKKTLSRTGIDACD